MSQLRLVFCIAFAALTLSVGWQEGHPANKNPEHVYQNNTRLTQIHPEKQSLNGTSSNLSITCRLQGKR